MDWIRFANTVEGSLLSPLIQMLISFWNPFTDTPRNNVSSAHPVVSQVETKLTHTA